MSENLDDLYKEVILDHYRRRRHSGSLPPPAGHARGFNPLCGDEVDVYVQVTDGIVTDVAIDGHGCAISQASASMMTEQVVGRPLEEILARQRRFKSMLGLDAEAGDDLFRPDGAPGSQLGDAEALQGVKAFPSRVKCATLAWNTLSDALGDATAPEPPDDADA